MGKFSSRRDVVRAWLQEAGWRPPKVGGGRLKRADVFIDPLDPKSCYTIWEAEWCQRVRTRNMERRVSEVLDT